MGLKRILERLDAALEEDESAPFFDPVHLGVATLATLVTIGALYWLLWSLLVYEGGLFTKAAALASVVFTRATLKDYGVGPGPFGQGVFEGWPANAAAFALTVGLLYALRRLYRDAQRRARR